MADTFEIRVNGKLFTDWEQMSVSRSIDTNLGVFSFTSTSMAPSEYPVRAGDAVQIVINKTALITGFVDSVTGSGTKDQGQGVTVNGRDNVSDLVDSTMPDAVKLLTGPVTLKSLCEQVIAALGAQIRVVTELEDEIEEFPADTEFAADSGRGCMDFLVSFARNRQVYLVADGLGRLAIFRPELTISTTAILNERDNNKNNVIGWGVSLDQQHRFNKYVIRSQDNFGADENADYKGDGIDRTGTAVDDEIRTSRFLEIQAPESSDDGEAQQMAIELTNLRTANSQEYSCTLNGLTQNDGTVWNFGQLIDIRDDFAGVRGVFLIKAVEYSIDLRSGSQIGLTLVPPEAYQVRLPTASDQRKATKSPILQRDTPAIPTRFPRT